MTMDARRFVAGRRRPVPSGAGVLVEMVPPADRGLPLMVTATVAGVDLRGWAADHRTDLEQWLHRHGAVLFRGFGPPSVPDFEAFFASLYPDLVAEHERSSPRSHVAGNVFTSTDHPADQRIYVHNEMSYSSTWPARLAFHCVAAPETGGQTPLADVREVYRLIDPAIRDRLVRRGVCYVRNYGDRFGLPWQTSFQTDDRARLEEYARQAGLTVVWRPDGGLRTRRTGPVTARHPVTGDVVWFNHATFFHVSTLEPTIRDGLLAELPEADLPTNSYYADGDPIEPEVLDHLRAAYERATVSFPWQAGDILLVDNMLVAHGRAPFTGARKVVVAMAQPVAEAETRA
ncbi:TauD/TfdA family dioxygenase [Plantactinospora sp. KLBMP9567]|uniref:TauD/TfdA family dioxygenase n=1 Tax=Plantactinospora sp. KLBMP9567 TaxID=3085900 RepID=UPI0029818BA9|nr:TauD/TfdA family dioxygenase [Plantactinospora sp. KLBMP9567]MDW5330240.1 TauD/TfdA family dioxygenase [Plantactinospora sp. KLBMP9567]